MYKFILKSIFILTVVFICGCEPVEKVEKISKRQPYVPFYTQMLLKGDVEEVLDSIYGGEFITTERFIFDEDYNVIHYYLNEGVDEDDFLGMLVAPFSPMYESYAFYICPRTWQEKRDTVIYGYGHSTWTDGDKSLRKNFKWDESGRITDFRVFLNGEAISYEGTFNLAEYLYDENGYPLHSFSFDFVTEHEAKIHCTCECSEFDRYGNPLKIIIYRPGGKETVIRRTIRYRE